MPSSGRSRARQRGFVRRRGNSFQVIVYAGTDPITGKDAYLRESTKNEREVEKIRTRLLAQVDAQRNAATQASLGYALDEWLAVHDADERTLANYRYLASLIIKPAVGDVALTKMDARTLERFYAQLRRCRARCGGKPYTEHATTEPHECGSIRHRRVRAHDCEKAGCKALECGPHECRPLGVSTVRQLHFIISGALKAAMRWGWIPSNPASLVKTPKRPSPQPSPPTPEQAARITAAAWEEDQEWGALVWLAMITGARRGELAALRWTDVDFERQVLEIRRSYTNTGGVQREKGTKTHQIRRIALDKPTVDVLDSHWQQYTAKTAELDRQPDVQAFVFSYTPDHSAPCNPDGLTHRFKKLCTSLGIDTHLHALRHYSATELIAAGIDIRTVAGRLGHGGGGNTTLQVYAAWVAESDKRAADALSSRLTPPTRTS